MMATPIDFLRPGALVLLLFSSCPTLCAADSLCSDFKKVVSDAPHLFKNLRGSFDFYVDEYNGAVTISPFDKCTTSGDEQVMEYKCDIQNLPDDNVAATEKLKQLAAQLEDCEGDALKKQHSVTQTIRYELKPDDEGVTLQLMHRLANDRHPTTYTIQLAITIVDLGAAQ
ncbi:MULTISPECIES: hypothetical protein [Paraburkholderia]|uniref:Uncharacterized protein n=1 Tax=Paraburkholderia madseniana TaxID=2599607 RepID=A0AAP5BC09_9BURK|nr:MULTISPECIES: hypothetical protein [Paraburkholderia]MCX4146926.1 hypothetical protein [Paraburkholderia madseniana]MDN7149871.1 hypothetical protein [Paraburkholderia sp. WS6]MDQ6408751.1 hypothetical protein [Paraburkholderia madseniana]